MSRFEKNPTFKNQSSKIKNRKINIRFFIFNISFFILFCGCKTQLPKGHYLLTSSSVRINNYKISREDLFGYIKQKPNRKILGIARFNLFVYRLGDRGKENRFNNWLKNTIGEPPVILDTNLSNTSINQLKLYLNSKGYFNSKIHKQIKYRKNKASIYFIIKTSKPYIYRNIYFSSQDSSIKKLLISNANNSLLKKGDNYDIDILEKERDRIAKLAKNNGYFQFSKEYVYFNADSTLKSSKMDVYVDVKPFSEPSPMKPDSIINVPHKQFNVNNIYIYTDFSTLTKDTTKFDTLLFSFKRKNTQLKYYFLYDNKLKYKPRTLTQAVFIKNQEQYKFDEMQETYTSLAGLQNFKFINIDFREIKDHSPATSLLDCKIRLTPLPKQSFTIETEGTNSGGDPGVAANLGYQNSNLFHGAEIFNMKLKGAVEVQRILSSQHTENIVKPFLPFNTIETGVETSLEIPKFEMPFIQDLFSQYNRPKTDINIGVDYQRRTDFTRIISNVSFGYKWKETSQKTHILDPIVLSGINVKMDSAFNAKIASLKDIYLTNSYTNHLTAGLKYSYIYNTQDITKKTDFMFFRTNVVTSGNLLYLIDKNFVRPNIETRGYYQFLNNRYAQFARIDADLRYYNIINKYNEIVYRAFAGLGIAYQNLTALPFEESFFSGGANGIRAWEIRSLGPGSYYDSSKTKFDKIGDIKIEGNVEYRFSIYKLWKGAAFIDVGNIWLKNKSPQLKGAEFQFDKFYKDIAMGWGLGTRFDFSFFVVRIDAAIPLRDPSKPENTRWVLKSNTVKDVVLNLGIGYPF